jgi:DNA-binding SARP family transcriptional activator
LYAATDAWCALASGDRDAAVAHLRLALDSAHPSKKIAKLCWIRHRLPDLFSLALRENIAPDLVKRLIREWRIPPASSIDPRWPWPVRIRVLGGFEVLLDDVPLHHRRKAPRRLLQLLKTIVAFGARDVAMSRLADAMFPQDDGGKGEDGLRVALQRLRDLLRAEGHVLLRDGKVSLSPQSVWVDAVAFDAGLRRATSPAEIDAALALYAGPLLEGEDDPNYLEPRERLQNRFLRHAVERAEAHTGAGRCDAALELYRRCADADVLNESFCQGVLRCCAALGRVAEGETAYRRLETALRDTFGRSPSEPTRRVFAALGDRRDHDR